MKKGTRQFSKGEILVDWDRMTIMISVTEKLEFKPELCQELTLMAKALIGDKRERHLKIYIYNNCSGKPEYKLLCRTYTFISFLNFLVDEFVLEIDTYGFGELRNASLLLFLIGQRRVIGDFSYVIIGMELRSFLESKEKFLNYVKQEVSDELSENLAYVIEEDQRIQTRVEHWNANRLIKSGVAVQSIIDPYCDENNEIITKC